MNIFDINEIDNILRTIDCSQLSDIYMQSPDVHSFVIEDLSGQDRVILLHINQRAQHSLTLIGEKGRTSSTSYTNHDTPMEIGEFLGHEVSSVMDMFLGPHNLARDKQRQIVKQLADDMLDGAVKFPGICGMFEALGSHAVPPVSLTQLALCLLQGVSEDIDEPKVGQKKSCALPVANAAVQALMADGIAYIKCFDVECDVLDAQPNVIVIFNKDKRTASVIVEHEEGATIHIVNGAAYKNGDSAKLWDPLLEMLMGTPELAGAASTVANYIERQTELGVLPASLAS